MYLKNSWIFQWKENKLKVMRCRVGRGFKIILENCHTARINRSNSPAQKYENILWGFERWKENNFPAFSVFSQYHRQLKCSFSVCRGLKYKKFLTFLTKFSTRIFLTRIAVCWRANSEIFLLIVSTGWKLRFIRNFRASHAHWGSCVT